MSKLEDILYKMIEEDDKGRDKVKYDLGDTIDRAIKKIKRLRLEDFNEKDN